MQIHSQKKKSGVIAPKRFVQRLKRDNELFRSYMHQVCLLFWLVTQSPSHNPQHPAEPCLKL